MSRTECVLMTLHVTNSIRYARNSMHISIWYSHSFVCVDEWMPSNELLNECWCLYTSRTQLDPHSHLHVLMSRCHELNVCWWLYMSRTQLDTCWWLHMSRTQLHTPAYLHVLMSRCHKLNGCWSIYMSRTQLETHTRLNVLMSRCHELNDSKSVDDITFHELKIYIYMCRWVDVTNWISVDDSICHELS